MTNHSKDNRQSSNKDSKTMSDDQRTQPRRVRFNDDPKVIPIGSLSDDERRVVWYTPYELAIMRDSERTNTRTSLDEAPASGGYLFDCQYFVESLLQQQYERRQLGLNDPKGLFQFSKAASKQSRLRAIQSAREHERLVQEISQEQVRGTISAALEIMRSDDFLTTKAKDYNNNNNPANGVSFSNVHGAI